MTLHGIVDAEGIDRLQLVLDDAVGQPAGSLRRVVFDLRDARDLDPSVATMFALAAERAHQRGVAFELHGGSQDVSRTVLGDPPML